MTNPEMAAGEPPVDYDLLLETTGLGPAELNQHVKFFSYEGSLLDAIKDNKCPVYSAYATGFAEKGLSGVEEITEKFKSMDSRFELPISKTTESYHRGEIDRDTLKSVQTESPDFLA